MSSIQDLYLVKDGYVYVAVPGEYYGDRNLDACIACSQAGYPTTSRVWKLTSGRYCVKKGTWESSSADYCCEECLLADGGLFADADNVESAVALFESHEKGEAALTDVTLSNGWGVEAVSK